MGLAAEFCFTIPHPALRSLTILITCQSVFGVIARNRPVFATFEFSNACVRGPDPIAIFQLTCIRSSLSGKKMSPPSPPSPPSPSKSTKLEHPGDIAIVYIHKPWRFRNTLLIEMATAMYVRRFDSSNVLLHDRTCGLHVSRLSSIESCDNRLTV